MTMRDTALSTWQGALRWRFGAGAAAVLPRAVVMPETGCVGKGNSVDVPCLPDERAMLWFGHVDRALKPLPDIYWLALALFHGDAGEVASSGSLLPSRRWRAVAPITQAAIEQAADWTARVDRTPEGPTSVLEVSVAQAIRLAVMRGQSIDEATPELVVPAWARDLVAPADRNKPEEVEDAVRRRDLRAGPASWRWVQWVFDPKAKPRPRDADLAAVQRVEREAKALIGAAQDAFALGYKPLRGEMG
jgi:hypothetical protein